MEYQLNGNIKDKWWYNKDIQSYDCNVVGKIYYQDYEYVFVNNKNVGGAKAIWSEDQNKMLLMYQGVRDQYNTKEKICSNFSKLSSKYGFDLTISFRDMVKSICPKCIN